MAKRGDSVRKAITIAVVISSMATVGAFSAQKGDKPLPLVYQKWLDEEVVYIISPVERDVFLKLETDHERDLFIEAFWKHRDPFPLTDQNEFREEHYKRIEYANRNFGRLSSAPGWKTDMGRIHIILGPPISMQRFEDSSFAYPVVVWSYQSMDRYGLPDQFNLVFYRRYGLGDYRLYSPIMDGPQSLLAMVGVDQSDPSAAYQALYTQSPELAQYCLSLIPGEPASPELPSLMSEQLLLNIAEAPAKLVDDDYARNLLHFKSTVGVEYSANFIGNTACVQPIRDPSGLTFVHYAIELERLSVERHDDDFITKLLVNGKVSDPEDRTIFQYERAIPVKLDEQQVKAIGPQKYSLGDVFPLAEGRYKLDFLVKNDASKEFTSVEADVTIPNSASLSMSSLLLAYKAEEDRSSKIKAFKVGDIQLFPALRHEFTTRDTLTVFFQAFSLGLELRQQGVVRYVITGDTKAAKTVDRALKDYPDGDSFLEMIPLGDIPPGYYKINVSLLDGAKKEVLSGASNFMISPVAVLPRPWTSLNVHASPQDPVYTSILAEQLFRKGETAQAKALAEKAYRANPQSPAVALSYAKMLFAAKDYAAAIEILTPLYANNLYESLELLGRSSQALGEYDKAIPFYKEYLSHFGANFYILTFLGECCYQTGDVQGALTAWEKSLELNPDQEDIRRIVETLKKKK
jgi:GWxTD domain-containing protein